MHRLRAALKALSGGLATPDGVLNEDRRAKARVLAEAIEAVVGLFKGLAVGVLAGADVL